MRRLMVALIVATLSHHASEASPIEIRSGEHADFSRLVFYFDTEAGWSLGRTADGYALEVANATSGFDTSGVFDFIPRSRILDVASDETSFGMDVTCDCHVEAFPYKPSILVVDVKDGPPDPGSVFEKRLDITGNDEPDPEEIDAERVASPRKISFPVVFQKAEAPVSPGDDPEDSELRRRLVLSLGRAASEGLARIAQPESPEPALIDAQTSDREEFPDVRMRTAFSRGSETADGLTNPREGCWPSAYLDFSDRDGSAEIYEKVSDARDAILSDLTPPTKGDVVRLARIYAKLGFGAEIRSLFATYQQKGAEASALLAVSGLLDNPEQAGPPSLQDQLSCGGAGTLWGFVALDDTGPHKEIDFEAVARELSALPLGLRQHLAPAVSDKLRQFGEAEAAAVVRDSVIRAVERPSGDMAIEVALSKADNGAAGETDTQLEKVAATNTDSALRAKAEILRRRARRGPAITAQDRDEIEALIYEAKGSDEAAELFVAYIDSLASATDQDAAMAYVNRVAKSDWVEPELLSGAIDAIYRSVVETAEDGTFLVFAVRYPPRELPAALGPAIRGVVADRLEMLRFDDVADLFASQIPDLSDPEKMRIRASSALSEGRPMEALARIARLDDKQSKSLRAEALIQTGAFEDAGRILSEIGDPGRAAILSWMGGDWQTASDHLPDGPRKDLARQIGGSNASDGGGIGSVTASPTADIDTDRTANSGQPGAAGDISDAAGGRRIFETGPVQNEIVSLKRVLHLIENSEALRKSAQALVNSEN